MYQIDAAAYLEATTILQQTISLVANWPGDAQISAMTANSKNATISNLNRIDGVIKPLNVPITKRTIRDAKDAIENSANLQYIACGQLLLEVSNNLKRELEASKIFALDARRAEFYEPDEPLFGSEVHIKFPSITEEISNGGKCYACDLTTAAAFHWIRCLESGVRAITRCLGIPEPAKGKDRNWSNISASIRDELERRWPRSTGRMTGDAKLFDKLYGSLAAIQNPYRNETMHLDAIYSDTEALHLFEVIKGLMSQIASRMDENGLPLA